MIRSDCRSGAAAALALALTLAPPPAPAQEGGTNAPGRVVVDPAQAERALERSLVQSGGLLLRPGRLELEPSLRQGRRETAGADDVDALSADLALRWGLPSDSQLELGLPYHYAREEDPDTGDSSSTSGLGDLRIGLAKTVMREDGSRPDVIARLTWDTRSGEDEARIGSGFHELRVSFTAIKRQDPLVFLGALAYEHALEHDDVQPGAAILPSFGTFVAMSPRTSMRFVLSQSFRQETEVNGANAPGTDQTAALFTVGGSSLLDRGVLLDVAVDIGLTRDTDDYAVRVALPIRF